MLTGFFAVLLYPVCRGRVAGCFGVATCLVARVHSLFRLLVCTAEPPGRCFFLWWHSCWRRLSCRLSSSSSLPVASFARPYPRDYGQPPLLPSILFPFVPFFLRSIVPSFLFPSFVTSFFCLVPWFLFSLVPFFTNSRSCRPSFLPPFLCPSFCLVNNHVCPPPNPPSLAPPPPPPRSRACILVVSSYRYSWCPVSASSTTTLAC